MKPYCLVYNRFDFPTVVVYFDNEISMKKYVDTWIDDSVYNINFYLHAMEYIPIWWAD